MSWRKTRRNNTLIVGHRAELGRTELVAGEVNWVSGQARRTPFHAQVKIRYKAQDASAIVTPIEKNGVRMKFEQPLRDITPGQAAVFFEDEVCLGGGIIQM